MSRVTVSVPDDVLAFMDARAAREHLSRSEMLVRIIEQLRRAELERDMEEGYRAMAEQNMDWALAAQHAGAEVVREHTAW